MVGFVKLVIEWCFWYCVIEYVDYFVIFEYYNGWDVVDMKLGVKFMFCFGVDFYKMYFFVMFFCDVFKDWCEVMVGFVLWCLEIDNDW